MVVEARPPMGSRSTVRHRNALFKAGVGSQETLAGRLGKDEQLTHQPLGKVSCAVQNVGPSLLSAPESSWIALDGVRNQPLGL